MLYLKDILKNNESNKGSTSGEDNNQLESLKSGSNTVDLMSLKDGQPDSTNALGTQPQGTGGEQPGDSQEKVSSSTDSVQDKLNKAPEKIIYHKVEVKPSVEYTAEERQQLRENALNSFRDPKKQQLVSETAKNYTRRREGNKGKGQYGVYRDKEGHLTMGYGHKLTPEEIKQYNEDSEIRKKWDNYTQEQAEELYQKDHKIHTEALNTLLKKRGIDKEKLHPDVYFVLTDMTFNMGAENLNGFNKFFTALKNNDLKEAARQMVLGSTDDKPSDYLLQVGNRAVENAIMLQNAGRNKSSPTTQAPDSSEVSTEESGTIDTQGEEPKQDIQGGVTTSNDDPYAKTLDYLNTTLKDKEGLLKTTKIPAKQILQKHYAQLKQDNMSRQQILSWAKIASKMINAITQYAAAREGLRKNLDLSGVKTEQADWDKEIDRAFKQYQTDYKSLLDREKAEDAEIARAERKEASLKKEINALRGLMARTEDSRARERARRAAEAKRYELAREREDRLSRQAEEKKKKEDKPPKRTKDEESAWFYVNDPKEFNNLSAKEKKKLKVKLGPAFAKYGFTVEDPWFWEEDGMSGLVLNPKNPDQDFIIDPDTLNPEDQKAFEFAISKPKDPRSKVLLKTIKDNYKK